MVKPVVEDVRPARIDAAKLLNDVEQFVGRFVAYPSEHARVAHALWIAHTHMMDAWDSTPRIAFLSPEPGSGKSRALEVTELLVPRPVEAVNVSPSYLFRKVGSEDGRPTILYDEIDTVFGPRAKDNEEIRGLLNAGHRRHSVAGRCVVRGKTVATEELPAYAAVALAGLGDLPDTILTRSIIVRMRRRAPTEHVDPYRRRIEQSKGVALCDRLAAWGAHVEPSIGNQFPELPDGIVDRHADVWESLIAIANAAGDDWPDRASRAAVAHLKASTDAAVSLGVRLLADLRTIFQGCDHLSTDDILESLCNLDESPWGDLRGKPINARGLAQRLRRYEVKPKPIRFGAELARGYAAEDLHDAWARYLPALSSSDKSVTSVTNVTSPTDQGSGVTDEGASVTDEKAHQTGDVTGVTHVTPSPEGEDRTAGLTDEQRVRAWMKGQGEDPEDIDTEIQRARDDPRVMQGYVEMADRAERRLSRGARGW